MPRYIECMAQIHRFGGFSRELRGTRAFFAEWMAGSIARAPGTDPRSLWWRKRALREKEDTLRACIARMRGDHPTIAHGAIAIFAVSGALETLRVARAEMAALEAHFGPLPD